MVRRDNRTVISMANDYRGELTEFALVVPVPQVLTKSQIHIGDRRLFERIDAWSAPRLADSANARCTASSIRTGSGCSGSVAASSACRASPAARSSNSRSPAQPLRMVRAL